MEKFVYLRKNRINNLPKTSGVYSFNSKQKPLYIGKANNIRERVKSHFPAQNASHIEAGKQPIKDEILSKLTTKIGYIKTDSEIEALLLESRLIKKYQPKFNVIWKDDKNYFWAAVSKDKLPRVFITHQTNNKDLNIGPFTDGQSLKKTLRFLRKAIPYYTVKKHSPNPCLWCHLQLCPGPDPNAKEYKKNINNLIRILKGEKTKALRELKKEMKAQSKKRSFERAAVIRDQIFALEKTISHARIFKLPEAEKNNWEGIQNLLQKLLKTKKPIKRIEGYDVSNIQGKMAAASMVVFTKGKPEKSLYRKFKIRIAGKPNDVAMLKETVTRRMSHNEWPLPGLILIDGGKPQLNAALSFISETPVLALTKRKNELYIKGRKSSILLKSLPEEVSSLILQIRDESHRFALAYHKKLREREVLNIPRRFAIM